MFEDVLILKKGGIHIKKKNRGKFTEYCGGKVTEECIAKGKKSKDPKIRKRATFASNARKWKHATGGPLGRPNFKESKEAYYDPETDTVFAPDSLGEFYHHEMFHARPNTQLLESLKPYYHNLNDDVLKQMGADLSFVKRFNNDPGHFYSPEELGARVVSASEMLNRMGVKDVTLDFLKNARLNESEYGDNFRDLLHMYNDENLIKIFNSVRKHENGGILKYQNPAGPFLELKDTLNTNYLAFKKTLPDNLRLTPEKDYHMYDYWRLSGEPKNFREGKRRGMFTWDRSDKGYHAGSIAEDRNTGIYHFMKPKHHPTVKYELDWFNKGLQTLEGGKQVPVEGKDKEFWEDFTSKYQLDTTGVDYRYVPIKKNGGILKAQEGTGNLYAPHPLSPVGIALNQAKAITKGKKDQQHLPPGVKEVVGPDGKKVAIRTEQSLVPLEQSIAEWLPGTGDIAEVGYIANDVKNGNYGTAALGAGLMFIPGNAGKLLSKHRKAVSKTADIVEDAVRKADVSEYINTVDDTLLERQPLTTNKSKQFWDGTSESKLTDAEKAGVPKGERNQPVKVKTYNEKQISPLLSAKYAQVHEAPSLDPNYLENSNLQRVKYQRLMDNKFENYFADTEEFNKTLQSYIDDLPDEIDPRFTSITDGEIIQPSIAVRGYRNYLLNNGVDAANISDNDLARLLTQEYKNLSATATGKLKNILLWHGSPTQFDSFDFSKTSANTGNSGALGPGNYFSTHGGKYGHTRNKYDYTLEMNNFQPYIISNITSTPAGDDMIKKGLLPEYISTAAMRSTNNQAILQKWISEIPTNDNRAYIDFTEATNGYFDGPRAGIMIRRNTGIKSLYPHPSRFIRNADGTVTLIPTDWNDVRVNFKQGGKL